MRICFLDYTKFQYSFEDKHSPKLRGAETVLINLSLNLKLLGNEIYVFNNSSKYHKEENYIWDNIKNINNYNCKFDIAISNGDINLLNKISAKKKFAISYSVQSIEKFIRKNQLLPYIKNKPKIILIGKYHKSQRTFLTRIYGYDYLNLSVDDIFNNEILLENSTNINKAIFTSRSDRNMKLLLNLWKKINITNKNLKLYVTPDKEYKIYEKYNIFFRKMGKQTDLIKDIKESRVMLIPGHKAELFCLAAEEARELCVPVITLGIGSLKERVEHNITGFVAKSNEDFCNLTIKLFNDNILWNKIRGNLLKMRGKTSWMKSSIDFLEVLKKS